MRRNWITFLPLVFLVSFINNSNAQEIKEITCTGKVVDAQGQPIADARVRLYEMVYGGAPYSYDMRLAEEATTKTDGAFSFSTSAESDSYRYGYIVAEKEGLALGCGNWDMKKDKALEIKLGQAKELAGIVVDENDKPVTQAEVGIYMLLIGEGEEQRGLSTEVASKLLMVNTNATGKFAFTNIPAEATAEFFVKKPGRAIVITYQRTRYAGQKLQFAPGQTDIKLVLPVEAKIEGTVVEKNTGKPIDGIKVMAMQDWKGSLFGQEPISSKEDGTFGINALVGGKHLLQLVQSREELADWVAEPVEVITEAGKTKSGVKVELSKGGVLEVEVTDAVNKKPIKKASVVVQHEVGGRFYSLSDKDGVARIRLMPGEYQISYIYKQGYSRQRPQDAITIDDGKTARIEWQLTSQPKIAGVVRDEKDNPLEGVKLNVCPMGAREDVTTDAEGKFEFVYDPGSWPGGEIPVMFLVGRYEEGNLAAAVEIDEDTRTLDIKLKPGVTFTGRVIDPDGKDIADARIMIMLSGPRWRSVIGRDQAKTDVQGKFEIKAIPLEHTYSIYTRAEGYGENRSQEISTNDAVNNQLDIGNISLAVANLSVSGVVVDVNDEPVTNVRVYCSGESQPRRQTRTDDKGRFTLEKVCAGRIRVSASMSGRTRLYGSIETEGGATDVGVVIRERQLSTRYVPKRPPSLVGRPLPELKDLKIDLSPTDVSDKIMLVCFWDMEQRPSRYCIRELAKRAEELKEKGVTVVAVQASKVDENTLNEWVKKYKIPFPVGMVQGDAEETRFTWGVKSLPWLILTDTEHVVCAEGFGLSELNGKLEDIAGE